MQGFMFVHSDELSLDLGHFRVGEEIILLSIFIFSSIFLSISQAHFSLPNIIVLFSIRVLVSS